MDSSDVKITPNAAQASLMSSRGVTGNANSPKMGSRRIFTPQFKLQVLESYRNDSDCKGNQRATARKYNIHRRQIQKWLQCESSLRSSVANINHNSVKHQFHNVSLLHPQQQQPQTQMQRNVVATNASIISNSFPSNQRNSSLLSVDGIIPEMSLSSVKVPSLSTENSTISNSNPQEIFKSSNLVTVVAAAAINSTNSTSSSATTSAAITPLRPSPIISSGRDTTASISPVFHSHHHNFGVPTFSLSHPHHICSQTQQQHDPPPYQYHKLVYPPSFSHLQTEKQQPSYFSPAALPTAINVISLTTSTTNSFTTAIVEHVDNSNSTQLQSKNYTSFVPNKQIDLTDDNSRIFNSPSTAHPPFIKSDLPFSTAFPFGPMDLTIHHRREVKSQIDTNIYEQNNAIMEKSPEPTGKVWDDKLDVVDLTYRKRKLFTNTYDEYNRNNLPEKLPKLTDVNSNSNEDEDVEIEVGVEEKFPPSKPVKLFKPYLLDNCENDNNSTVSSSSKNSKNESNELTEKNLTKSTNASNESTFPIALRGSKAENFNFLVDSRSASPRGAFSPSTNLATLSPKSFQCPKGSPASSGYESSTSSYSDSSLSSRCENYGCGQSCSINMRMQSIYSDTSYQSKHVQSWLDKDDAELLATSSSIALLA